MSIRPAANVVERPAWRPDGRRLVVAVRNFITARVNADGSDYREERLGCFTPSWSPDGEIGACSVITGEGSGGSPKIYVYRTQGDFRGTIEGGTNVVYLPTREFVGIGRVAHQVVNATSDWVAWWDDMNKEPAVRLAGLDLAGAPRIEPRTVGKGMEPRWSPTEGGFSSLPPLTSVFLSGSPAATSSSTNRSRGEVPRSWAVARTGGLCGRRTADTSRSCRTGTTSSARSTS